MIAIKNVLCPIDFSPYSRGALGYALAVAGSYDARVTALHVAPKNLPPLSRLAERMGAIFEPHGDPKQVASEVLAE